MLLKRIDFILSVVAVTGRNKKETKDREAKRKDHAGSSAWRLLMQPFAELAQLFWTSHQPRGGGPSLVVERRTLVFLWLKLAAIATMITGLFSASFHATLQYSQQKLDESFENIILIALMHAFWQLGTLLESMHQKQKPEELENDDSSAKKTQDQKTEERSTQPLKRTTNPATSLRLFIADATIVVTLIFFVPWLPTAEVSLIYRVLYLLCGLNDLIKREQLADSRHLHSADEVQKRVTKAVENYEEFLNDASSCGKGKKEGRATTTTCSTQMEKEFDDLLLVSFQQALSNAKKSLGKCILCFIVAGASWLIDFTCCKHLERASAAVLFSSSDASSLNFVWDVPHLHAFGWHVFSAMAVYFGHVCFLDVLVVL